MAYTLLCLGHMRLFAYVCVFISFLVPVSARAGQCPSDTDACTESLAQEFALAAQELHAGLSPWMSLESAWRWQVQGAVTLDGRTSSEGERESLAALTMGFDVAYASAECRWVGLAGGLQAYADQNQEGLSGSETFTFCLPLPMHLPEISIQHEHELRPHLAAPPFFRASRLSSWSVSMRSRMLRFNVTPTSELRIARTSLDIGSVKQPVDEALMDTFDAAVDVSSVEVAWPGKGFLGANRVLDIMLVRVISRTTEIDATGERFAAGKALVFSPVRLTGFGRAPFFFDFDLGVSTGTLSEYDLYMTNPDGTSERTNTDTLVSTEGAHLDVHMMWSKDARAHGLRYRQEIAPSSYRALVVDQRLSGWTRFGSSHGDSSGPTDVHGFLARSTFIDENRQLEQELTGGIGLSRYLRLHGPMGMNLSAEFARSFYASLHGTAQNRADWTARVVVDLSARTSRGY